MQNGGTDVWMEFRYQLNIRHIKAVFLCWLPINTKYNNNNIPKTMEVSLIVREKSSSVELEFFGNGQCSLRYKGGKKIYRGLSIQEYKWEKRTLYLFCPSCGSKTKDVLYCDTFSWRCLYCLDAKSLLKSQMKEAGTKNISLVKKKDWGAVSRILLEGTSQNQANMLLALSLCGVSTSGLTLQIDQQRYKMMDIDILWSGIK